MSPVSREMEINGWSWNSQKQLYQHTYVSLFVTYAEASIWYEAKKIRSETARLLAEVNKKSRRAKK